MTASLTGLCPQPQWCSLLDATPAPAPPDHPEAYRIVVRDGVTHVDAATSVGSIRAGTTLDQLHR